MKTKIYILIVLIGLRMTAYAQYKPFRDLSFGFQIATQIGAQPNSNNLIFDSITVQNYEIDARNLTFNIFGEKQISKSLALRTEITYVKKTYLNYIVRDLKPTVNDIIVEVEQGFYVPTIQIPVIVSYKIPHQKFISLVGGLDNHFQTTKPSIKINYKNSYFLRSNAVDVYNALEGTTKNYVPFYIIGLRVDVSKFTFIARYKHSIGSYTHDMHIRDNSYSFPSQQAYFFFTLGYKFFNIKTKKREEGE